MINKLKNAESRIFISGPAGSGKELVARQIHKQSSRSSKPFVVVNGALLDPQKYELELFGAENLMISFLLDKSITKSLFPTLKTTEPILSFMCSIFLK